MATDDVRPAPTRFGRYELVERLAAGGMGEVFVGRVSGGGGFLKVVAIKRIHPEHSQDPNFVAMLHDEANLGAAVKHPCIVAPIDVGEEQGQHFVVMEFVCGSSLSKLLAASKRQGTPFPPWVVAWIGAQIGSALHAVHEARDLHGAHLAMVHRDVSPHNIMLADAGHAMLFDFGIAKAHRRAARTEIGVLKGKLAYMAPELFHGAPVDRSIDVFGLGVVLYELLTGVSPFRRDSDVETVVALQAAVTPPHVLAPVDPVLEAIVLSAMARERERRPATAEQLARALEAWARQHRAPHDADSASAWLQGNFPERVAAGRALLARVAEAPPAPAAESEASRGRAPGPLAVPDARPASTGTGVSVGVAHSAPNGARWPVALAAASLVLVGVVAALTAVGRTPPTSASGGETTGATTVPATVHVAAKPVPSAAETAPVVAVPAPAACAAAAPSAAARPIAASSTPRPRGGAPNPRTPATQAPAAPPPGRSDVLKREYEP